MTQRAKNASSSSSATATPENVVRFKSDGEKQEDLRRIRLLQQEKTALLAIVAEKKRKEKADQERMRKNLVAKKKHEQGGDVLGGDKKKKTTTTKTTSSASTTNSSSSSSSTRGGGGFNPLQPWTGGGSGGYKYVFLCIFFRVRLAFFLLYISMIFLFLSTCFETTGRKSVALDVDEVARGFETLV
jgi:hypothetical protein